MRFFILAAILLGLIACANQNQPHNHQAPAYRSHQRHQQDSAPKHPKKAIYQILHPKYEAISKYGNPDSYRVGNKTYQVMPNSKGYKQRGIASWYGTKFDKRRTSSGEKYNMYALTAAHRTLPIPSYIRVKNLNNGRTAIIRVNDRGPFHSSRLLDLSYGSAKYLGVFPKGTALVEIETILPKTGEVQHVAHYYIQASASDSSKLAQQFRQKLRRFTKQPVQVIPYQKKYIVRIGPMQDRKSTVALKQQLAKNGITGIISYIQ